MKNRLMGFAQRKRTKLVAIAASTAALASTSMAQETGVQAVISGIVDDVKAAATTNIGLAMGVGAVFLIGYTAWRAIKRFIA